MSSSVGVFATCGNYQCNIELSNNSWDYETIEANLGTIIADMWFKDLEPFASMEGYPFFQLSLDYWPDGLQTGEYEAISTSPVFMVGVDGSFPEAPFKWLGDALLLRGANLLEWA